MGVPDNGLVIVGITWWLTFLCGAFLGLRIYAKLSRKQKLWWDDHILIVSWFLLLIEAILTQVGRNIGFGKRTADISVEHIGSIIIYTSIGASVSCFASTLSKISFGVTLLRLTMGPLRWFIWFCIVTLFLIMLPSALNPWIQCRPFAKVWDDSIKGTCFPSSVTVNYGIFNAAWCAAADFALALIPWKLIWGLQLQTRDKIGVGIAMSMGVLAGICAIVKGVYIVQLRQQDFFYNGKDVTIWTVVETATAIIGASIPVLRVFFIETMSSYSGSRGRSGSHSNKTSIPVPWQLQRSPHSGSHTATVQAMGRDKDRGWVSMSMEQIEDRSDDASQRSILRHEEDGLGRGDSGAVVHEDDGILQTNTVTVTVEDDGEMRYQDAQWLGDT
ncbi:hypothetical protein T440DRAFT_271686 [Plenodomus tracheiphilus IPT5]|uniref:Rhodopsin domain-containing protein n=1 Tax=Plenodomus tracheiphilus IPT5 TaxID=1408161 RepID=A0A6A7BFI4_9PLEO|nr:hypothetical protein T440DRAFT_271686 [Plenodomus tracheiphilus IPT5]